ncbi:hypothetical protein F4679DRAFT_579541 [Xylaria curta]|nr:hypothetical protein F4679DRAFT_579541 [Xylaria curta]
MSTSSSPEQTPASNTDQPNELQPHLDHALPPSVIISSIQVENSETPVTSVYHQYDFRGSHNTPAQYNWDTRGHNTIPSSTPPSAIIPTQAPAPALVRPTPGTAGPSILLGFQHASIPRAPNNIVFQAQPMSRNYRGNPLSPRNQSANIPPEQSTSVWITNLPPDCNYADLLGMVQDAGKVYAAVISPPGDKFITSAAKIVFFDLEGRQRFEARANAGQFAVSAYVPRVRPNRILTEAQPVGPESRILHITGPESIVNQHVLLDYFRRWCAFDIEYVQRWPLENRYVTMVWAFASYRCQAERVFAAIRDIRAYSSHSPGRGIWDTVVVRFGQDPCDRNTSHQYRL